MSKKEYHKEWILYLGRDEISEGAKELLLEKFDEFWNASRDEIIKGTIKKIKVRMGEIKPEDESRDEMIISLSKVSALGELIEINGEHSIFTDKELINFLKIMEKEVKK